MPAANTIRQELISPEVQEIISYRPHWLIRRGNMIFFVVMLGVLAGTWFIQYPDIVNGSVRIVAVDGPKTVTTKTEGNLVKLLVQNEEQVMQGQALAFIQSTGKHEEVFQLQNWISKIEQPIINDSLEILLNESFTFYNNLGELQTDYETFRVQLRETMELLQSGYYQQKKKALYTDLSYLKQLQRNLSKQNQLLQEEYQVQTTDFNVKDQLTKEKVIAPLELNQEKGKLLLKEQGLEQMTAQLINSNVASHNKQKELLDLQKYVSDQRIKFQAALLNLKSKTEDWIKRFVLIAPQDGKLFYTSFIQENQFLSANTELFYVQPLSTSYYGSLTAGQNGIGKIAANQDVLIRLQGYPSEQFGYIKGKVSYISNLPNRNDSFLIKVDLPNGLVTNQQKHLFFRNNLLAYGEVITENRRLFERFTGKLYDMMKRK
ncbi:MAG: HlyD family secretion protein [Chitinophagaceae bacterium]|nr:HlyD family secretion protein [Chitinophagaceae bacterium]